MESSIPEGDGPPPATSATRDDYTSTRRSKGRFRFKSSSKDSSSRRHPRDRSSEQRHRSSRREKYSHGARAHTSTRTRSRSPSPLDPRNPTIDAEAAFRESLFDALGDDEGAAYWESVYGQPIHNYAVPELPKGPEGELERMDEEEYAAYVRAQMWARTREGMMEEQDRLRAERRKTKKREDAARSRDQERDAFERAMEDSLRRGAERKKKKEWTGVWEEYLRGWEAVAKAAQQSQGSTSTTTPTTSVEGIGAGAEETGAGPASSTPLRNLLFWPVKSGKRCDITPDAVGEFLKRAPPEGELLSTLKVERVRWHPDKIQHRYAVLGIDDKILRSVTEVFQIVDRMWNEERERAGKT